MNLNSKPGRILSISYLALLLLTTIPMMTCTGDCGLAGLFSGLLTLPWIILFSMLQPTQAWDAPVSLISQLLFLLLGGFINAIILYKIGAYFDGTNKNEPPAAARPPEITNNLWKKFNIFFFLFLILFILSFNVLTPGFFPTYFAILTQMALMFTIGYFGFALAQKKKYLFLGLLALIPFISLIGLIASYFILWQIKKSTVDTKTTPELS